MRVPREGLASSQWTVLLRLLVATVLMVLASLSSLLPALAEAQPKRVSPTQAVLNFPEEWPGIFQLVSIIKGKGPGTSLCEFPG